MNSFWALSNLAWDPGNQLRISKYMSQLIAGCKSDFTSVQTNAICCLGNLVCYNEKICTMLAESRETMNFIFHMYSDKYPKAIQFSALRTVLSLSYSINQISILKNEFWISNLVKRSKSEDYQVQKMALLYCGQF